MSYEHRSNVHIRGIPLPFKVLGVLIIIVLPIYLFLPSFFPNIFARIAIPFWSKPLQKPTLSPELEHAFIAQLQMENAQLKSAFQATSTQVMPHIYPIVKKPPFTVYDSYIIEIGKDATIQIGDKVYALGKVLIGEIVEINGRFAKVKLYSSYGEKFDVLIGSDNIEAPALGLGGGAFEVVLPKDVKIRENDIVTIPDLSVSVFGIVKSVTIDPARAFSTILFSQPINIYQQKWVALYENR